MLVVDVNQGLTLGDGLRRCHVLDDQGLYWFQGRVAYSDLRGHAQPVRAGHRDPAAGVGSYSSFQVGLTTPGTGHFLVLAGARTIGSTWF